MNAVRRSTQSLIDELVQTSGAETPEEAIRRKARELVDLYVANFSEPTMPMDMDVLASLRSIGRSDDRPVISPDAELAPDGSGGVTMRVNPDRPETRQRFSVAHEISHTFFPDYTTKDWCRTDARYRDRTNPDEYLEKLCDIAAAELLFPQPWFSRDAAMVADAAALANLAVMYHASREATIRRFAETSSDSLAAVYFVWKLKPKQKGTVGRKDQLNLLGISPEEEYREALRLRIEYTIPSEPFRLAGHYLPNDKSIDSSGPIYDAAASGVPCDGESFLDLGQAAGTYKVYAVPLWTGDAQRGANGENIVAAILQPLAVKKPNRKRASTPAGPSLFDDL